MQRSAGLMAMFLPGHEFQETQNKIEAFRLFAFVDKELEFSQGIRLEPLPDMVCRAGRLGNYKSIWAMEGVAHFYTAAVIQERRLRALLADPELPATAMVPLHMRGMGTACAQALTQPARRCTVGGSAARCDGTAFLTSAWRTRGLDGTTTQSSRWGWLCAACILI